MRRYRVRVSYDGSGFHGWQVQPNMRTVQGEFHRVLERLGESVMPYGAGRTDAGVHALGNVAHFDLRRQWEEGELLQALRSLAPRDVGFEEVQCVPRTFHARYDARDRRYAYVFAREQNPFNATRALCLPRIPEASWVRRELECLAGHRDFASLCQAGSEPRTTLCTIHDFQWWTFEKGAMLTVQANRFLYGMMRALVGTLLQGARTGKSGYLDDVLNTRSRGDAGPTAPPWGLYLVRASYDQDPPLEESWCTQLAALAGIGGENG